MGTREDRKKTFAEIWEEEQSKYKNQKKDELKKNKGLIKLGKPISTSP